MGEWLSWDSELPPLLCQACHQPYGQAEEVPSFQGYAFHFAVIPEADILAVTLSSFLWILHTLCNSML
jgi:hypothetical protein